MTILQLYNNVNDEACQPQKTSKHLEKETVTVHVSCTLYLSLVATYMCQPHINQCVALPADPRALATSVFTTLKKKASAHISFVTSQASGVHNMHRLPNTPRTRGMQSYEYTNTHQLGPV